MIRSNLRSHSLKNIGILQTTSGSYRESQRKSYTFSKRRIHHFLSSFSNLFCDCPVLLYLCVSSLFPPSSFSNFFWLSEVVDFPLFLKIFDFKFSFPLPFPGFKLKLWSKLAGVRIGSKVSTKRCTNV